MNKLGKIGEDTATRYLEKMKYTILKRNYRNRRGEIDIIASYNRTLVIVEVKARSNNRFGNTTYIKKKYNFLKLGLM